MQLLFIGLVIGLIAALLEIAMIKTYQKNKVVLLAIALHWIGIGGLMPFMDFGTPIWAKGILVGVISTIPFIVLETQRSKNAVIHTSVFAPVWGLVIAYGSNYFL